MPRTPSEKTQLASARREIKFLEKELKSARATASEYRARATSAEQSAADWRRRFDLLLEKGFHSNGGGES